MLKSDAQTRRRENVLQETDESKFIISRKEIDSSAGKILICRHIFILFHHFKHLSGIKKGKKEYKVSSL